MKKIKSSLFEKLKDNEIISNTNLIIGGAEEGNPGSNQTPNFKKQKEKI